MAASLVDHDAGLIHRMDFRYDHTRLQAGSRKAGLSRLFNIGFAGLLAALLAWPAAVDAAMVTLKVGGTGSALGSMQLLAGVFKQTHPDVDIIVLPSLGSGGGIKALRDGVIDVALSSRPLKRHERNWSDDRLIEVEYASTPLVFVTRPENNVDNITSGEVAATFGGEIKAWPNGQPRRLVLRPPSESDNQILRNLSDEMDRAVDIALTKPGMTVAANDQENAEALEAAEGAFGAMTLGQLRTERRRLKVLDLDGVAPSPDSLAAGSYPMFKRLYLITDAAGSPLAAEFAAFLQSPPAKNMLLAFGHLPTASE